MSGMKLEPLSPNSQPSVLPANVTRTNLVLAEVRFIVKVSCTQRKVGIQSNAFSRVNGSHGGWVNFFISLLLGKSPWILNPL